jgi:hypothetical protein
VPPAVTPPAAEAPSDVPAAPPAIARSAAGALAGTPPAGRPASPSGPSAIPAADGHDRPPAAPPPRGAPSADSLAREAAMLEEARSLLERDPGAALAALDRYASVFPSGSLGIERELLAVSALRRLGRAREAQARGAALLQQARGSIYEERVRALLQGPR